MSELFWHVLAQTHIILDPAVARDGLRSRRTLQKREVKALRHYFPLVPKLTR